MLIPAFQLHLSDPIFSGLACTGKFDGKHPSLTCATSGGKIFMHNPHAPLELDVPAVRYLNMNKQVSAVCAGELNFGKGRDLLFVGSQTDLLAYDTERNADHFFKEVTDGVNAMVCGRVPSVDSNLAIVGGNCSIQ
ncbi:hypothetical protein CYMTET_20509, partial [Cymbomonas tetramitiformis]